jgi:hypothetical protein
MAASKVQNQHPELNNLFETLCLVAAINVSRDPSSPQAQKAGLSNGRIVSGARNISKACLLRARNHAMAHRLFGKLDQLLDQAPHGSHGGRRIYQKVHTTRLLR